MGKNKLLTIIIIIFTIATGLSGIVTQLYSVWGIILSVVGILLAIYLFISIELRQNYLEKMTEAQNMILASKQLGNVYYEMVESDFKKTGHSPKGIDYLKKAYDIDSNNIEVLKRIAGFLALNISSRKWAGESKSKKLQRDWELAKAAAERGLKIDPKERFFMDALGILNDTAGHHKVARKWFKKSSQYRDDPYWHLMMATSWAMSGNYSKQIQEIELAINQGASGWIVNMEYGDALIHSGKCEEGLWHLNQAKRIRGMHPYIIYDKMYALLFLNRFSISIIIDLGYLLTFFISYSPWYSRRQIVWTFHFVIVYILNCISRAIWILTSKSYKFSKFHCKILSPCSCAFQRGCIEMKRVNYNTALNFFTTCYSMCPKYVHVLINLAICYAFLQNREKAIELIDEALTLEPQNELLLWNKKQVESGIRLRFRWFEGQGEIKKAYKSWVKSRFSH